MENFMISVQVVTPLFLAISFGYFLKWVGILEEDVLFKLNAMVYKAFFPLLMFHNIYQSDISKVIDGKLILFAVVFLLILVIALICLVPKLEKENTRRGVLIQAIYRSNFIIFGLTMVTTIYGTEESGSVAVLVAVIIPLFNIIAVLVLELFRGNEIDIKRVLYSVAKNPLIIGAVFGIAASVFPFKLPLVVISTIDDFASMTSPLALIVLGATFHFSAFHKMLKPIFIGVLGRLIIVPGIGIPLAIYFGFRGSALMGLLAMFGSPTAISSYPMAQQMGGDGELAGQLVVFSSAFSMISIFLWIFGLKQLGYL